jgi:hypothetical protein
MNGLDNHYSALWVANERRLDDQRPQTYKITIAVEGYVEVEIEAHSREEACASAIDRVEVQGITTTDMSIEDVEVIK